MLAEINIPKEINIQVNTEFIEIKGPLGRFIKKKDKNLNIFINNQKLYIEQSNKFLIHLLNNFFWGVSKGYIKHLELHGIGFRANVENQQLIMRLGFSHDVVYNIPKQVQIYTPQPTDIIVKGYDHQLTAQVAAEIKQLKLPEPYKGKGIRYVDEIIYLKEGKKN